MKKKLAIALCMVFILMLIGGCGQSPSQEIVPGAGANTNASDGTAKTPDVSSEPSPSGFTEPPVHIVLVHGLWDNADPENDYAKAVREEIIKAINVDVEVVGQFAPVTRHQKANLMLAAGEQIDIFDAASGSVNNWRKFKKDGVLAPLNDLLEEYGQRVKEKIDPGCWDNMEDNEGVIWALPWEQLPADKHLVIRQDWLDALGLDIPVTVSDFEIIMQAFQENFNDPGFCTGFTNAELSVFLGSFVDHNTDYYDPDTGLFTPVWVQPGYVDYLAKMQEWYQKGYLHKEIMTMQFSYYEDLVYGGRMGIARPFLDAYGFGDFQTLLQENVPEGKWTPIAPPIGLSTGKVTAAPLMNIDVMISASCKNPEAAMKFIDYTMGTDEGWLLVKYGIGGVHYNMVDESIGLVEVIGVYNHPLYAPMRLNSTGGRFVSDLESVEAQNFYNDPARYPVYTPIALGFPWDNGKISRYSDKTEAVGNERNNLYAKIIMGEAGVDEWIPMIEKYLNSGGADLYAERTRQLREAGWIPG